MLKQLIDRQSAREKKGEFLQNTSKQRRTRTTNSTEYGRRTRGKIHHTILKRTRIEDFTDKTQSIVDAVWNLGKAPAENGCEPSCSHYSDCDSTFCSYLTHYRLEFFSPNVERS
ncbi:hypothetical protein AMELA_G00009480 [Ameiurus melas]|uniref:Uncharacterized protein n=1 Tax=Ameiurus melas TaxID=219545 RepID=A0A7J6BKF8_AMEME|nr:hypothetical protein AMELA_G00009480 [Ameiurus melas]